MQRAREGVVGNTKIQIIEEKNRFGKDVYKVFSKQKHKNIHIQSVYTERSSTAEDLENKTFKNINFFIEIKVFSKQSKNSKCYQINAGNLSTKYNKISRLFHNDCLEVLPNSEEYENLKQLLKLIEQYFDYYTIRFIESAVKIVENKKTIDTTPQFVIDTTYLVKSTVDLQEMN